MFMGCFVERIFVRLESTVAAAAAAADHVQANPEAIFFSGTVLRNLAFIFLFFYI